MFITCQCGSQIPIGDPNRNIKIICPNCSFSFNVSATQNLQQSLTDTHLKEQEMFAHYQIQSVLGKGGMGVVYKALDTRINRVVALKKILDADEENEKETRRFIQEAKAIAQLEHPNIVKLYDVGKHPQNYFTMEYIEGKSFGFLLKEKQLSLMDSIIIVQKIARALHTAHSKKIIHRDIKPNNVMIAKNNEPKIMDFGLAKLSGRSAQLSKTGEVMGTPQYMSPEQVEGKKVDSKADIYSLGATLYKVLTHKTPFEGGSYVNVFNRIISEEPMRPRQIDENIPKELETICLKCLEKQPENRYRNMLALARDLDNFIKSRPLIARKSKMHFATQLYKKHSAFIKLILALTLGILIGYSINKKTIPPIKKPLVVPPKVNIKKVKKEKKTVQKVAVAKPSKKEINQGREDNAIAREIAARFPANTALRILMGANKVSILKIGYKGLTASGAKHLQNFKFLRELEIQDAAINDTQLQFLSGLEKIKKLNLNRIKITGVGLKYLSSLSALENINLGETKINNTSLVYLKNFPRLKSIELISTNIDDRGLVHLKNASQLKYLGLSRTKVTGEGLQHLTHLARFEQCSLEHAPFNDQGAMHLSKLKNLSWVLLQRTQISDIGLKYLTTLKKIYWLVLAHTNISNAGLIHFKSFPVLGWLHLDGMSIYDSGIKNLIEVKSLNRITLSDTKISDLSLKYLSQLPRLTWIELDNTQISDSGLAHLKDFKRIVNLSIKNTNTSDLGLISLGNLLQLEELNLENSKITSTGLKYLTRLKKLRQLVLVKTNIDDGAIAHLAKITSLRNLYIKSTRISKAGIAALRRSLPKCQIGQ